MIRRLPVSSVLMLVSAVLLSIPSLGGHKTPAAKPYTLAVTAHKVLGSANQFECYVTATEVATHQIVFAPMIETVVDDEAKASTKDPQGREFFVSVLVQSSGTKVTYHFSAKQDGKLVQKDKGTVAIE